MDDKEPLEHFFELQKTVHDCDLSFVKKEVGYISDDLVESQEKLHEFLRGSIIATDDFIKEEIEVCENNLAVCELEIKSENCDDYNDSRSSEKNDSCYRKSQNNSVKKVIIMKNKKNYSSFLCGQDNRYSNSKRQHPRKHFGKHCITCNFCGKIFVDKNEFFSHSIHYVKSSKKRRLSAKLHMTKYSKILTNETRYKCEICNKQFDVKSTLVYHMRIHTGEKPFKCDICFKQFAIKRTLTTHLLIHSGQKFFKCQLCSKEFTEKSNLTKHYMIHTGEKPFKCEICSKAFNHKSHLTTHLRIHTGEKPFQCEVCSKQFNRNSHLKRHSFMHEDRKPFKCKICSKNFIVEANLMEHLRICSEQVGGKSNLRKRVRKREKLFQCEICPKHFCTKTILVNHLRTHTGERPFQCEFCLKRYTHKSSLTQHLRFWCSKKA